MKARTRGALFDLDGVLIDSWPIWLAVVDDAAERMGRPPVGPDRLRAFWGQGLEEDAKHFYPGAHIDEVRAAFAAAMPQHLDRVDVDPEAHRLLDELGARGVKRAIVTNTQDGLAEQILAVAGLLERVDFVAALTPQRREKPAPDIVLAALEALGLAPEEALVVGDTTYDEQAAAAAGVRFLLHRSGRDGNLRERVNAAL